MEGSPNICVKLPRSDDCSTVTMCNRRKVALFFFSSANIFCNVASHSKGSAIFVNLAPVVAWADHDSAFTKGEKSKASHRGSCGHNVLSALERSRRNVKPHSLYPYW